VPGVHDGLGRQREQARPDRAQDRGLVAVAAAGRTRSAAEQRVAAEHVTAGGEHEATPARRVTGRVQDTELRITGPQRVALGEIAVRHPVGVDVVPEHPIVGMQQDRRVDRVLQRHRGVDVVVVAVRERDRGHPTTANGVDDRGGVVRGVDDHDLAVVTDQPDVVGHVPLAAVEAEDAVGGHEFDHGAAPGRRTNTTRAAPVTVRCVVHDPGSVAGREGERERDGRRRLPSVEVVRRALDDLPHALAVRCARDAVDAARRAAVGGADIDAEAVVADARRRADRAGRATLRPLINATGVLLHTNLGRAPLGREALQAVVEVAGTASSVEYDVDRGERGSRHDHVGHLLAALTGAEDGLVVNNNAAAVLLVLSAMARDRAVVVSRGELVEIGGGFRIPDIVVQSGCRLVEVGTTNKTRTVDYERAFANDAGAIVLKVHTSNYRVVGYTEDTPVRTLATLGAPVVVDLGSGLLDEQVPWLATRPTWLGDEPGVRQAVDAGADVVTFSGDKLLGGPQAGIIVGRTETLDVIRRHPLARAVRVDKMTLAALDVVLRAYLRDDVGGIPFWAMATRPIEELRDRADAMVTTVPSARVVATEATVGGGSIPGARIPSVGLAVETRDAQGALAMLREHSVVARVHGGSVVTDLRTVDPADDPHLAKALLALDR
jgi:L-seryl-tRNA(Ser) seleniumtransferase